MGHVYDSEFFSYLNEGSTRSARVIVRLLLEQLPTRSILDVGCGQGAWLAEWRAAGVEDVFGVDGDYVRTDALLVPKDRFTSVDLRQPVSLGRAFDLVQCLEVAEHLPEAHAVGLIQSITAHGKIVLFSAATVGQGGEHHVNEQPLGYWRDLFAAHQYQPFDFIRPAVRNNREIEPWYRYNTLLYAHADTVAALPQAIRTCAIGPHERIKEGGDMRWRLRRTIVSLLPFAARDGIARVRSQIVAASVRSGRA